MTLMVNGWFFPPRPQGQKVTHPGKDSSMKKKCHPLVTVTLGVGFKQKERQREGAALSCTSPQGLHGKPPSVPLHHAPQGDPDEDDLAHWPSLRPADASLTWNQPCTVSPGLSLLTSDRWGPGAALPSLTTDRPPV